MAPKSDEHQYCSKDATTPGLPTLLINTRFITNLEVTVLYAQVQVKVLLVVTVHLARDPRGSKPDFYRVRRSLIL